eukprot:4899528-Pleurochrysis_carterae.AAC.1
MSPSHSMRLTRYYLATLLCTRRLYVWAPSKLVAKPTDISATVRSWTDGRLDSLRGKTVVTSHPVTFTYARHVMHVCRFHSGVGLYGSVLNLARRPTYACAHDRVCALARLSH